MAGTQDDEERSRYTGDMWTDPRTKLVYVELSEGYFQTHSQWECITDPEYTMMVTRNPDGKVHSRMFYRAGVRHRVGGPACEYIGTEMHDKYFHYGREVLPVPMRTNEHGLGGEWDVEW
ncbi:MAG: hypothetical protein WAS51_14590 [Ilumatobacteraceae bacterium]